MNECITVVIPSCPSGFKPYPKLTIKATVQDFRIIATCLRALEKSSEPICYRLCRMVVSGYEDGLHDRCNADEPMYRAIIKALGRHWHITTYCLQNHDWPNLNEEDEIHTNLRSTWIDHIERSIWEQIGN